MHDYPRAASRGFSLVWLLAITNSFVWLKAMQERNLCSQGRTWQKCMQTSFRFLHVSSNREHNGSCSNLVPRALFPGFGGGPGKSGLGTRLCFLNYFINAKTGPFPTQDKRYNLDSVLSDYRAMRSTGYKSPYTAIGSRFFSFFSGEREIWRRHIRRAQSQDRTSLDQIYR